MTDHEMLLLRAAVEACQSAGHGLTIYPEPLRGFGQVVQTIPPEGEASIDRRGILAVALTALLRDLGADVPEWPSEERVAEASERLGPVAAPTGTALHYLRALPLPEYLALRGGS